MKIVALTRVVFRDRNTSVVDLSSFRCNMSYKLFVDQKETLMRRKLLFQRWFYAFAGVLTMIPVILLTWGEMQNFKQENHDFAFCLLLLVHSGWFRSNQFSFHSLFCLACVIFSLIATALFCRKFNRTKES